MPKPAIDPQPWSPPDAPPLEGPYAANRLLETLERWPVPGEGPEDIAFDEDGRAHTGLADGRIVRFAPDGSERSIVARVPGRPLGIERDPRGGMIVCSERAGLLHVDPDTGEVTTIVDEIDGERMLFCNNAAVTADGARIFFSDSSRRFDFDTYMADVFEHSGTGRLIVHDRDGGETRVLLGELYFANGVALADDESFVVVAETERYRIRRWWLTGEHADTVEVLIDNLPGLPDNLTTGSDGSFWVALPNPRDAILDRILPLPRLRGVVWRLPEAIQPGPTRYGFVVGIDADGEVVNNLQGPSGEAYAEITTAREHDGYLYLGSIHEHAIARVRIRD